MIGKYVGEELSGVAWLGIPFGGGMCELTHLDCRSIVVSDKHKHIINLCRALKDPIWWKLLTEYFNATPFHPDELAHAQEYCRSREPDFSMHFDVECAKQYFISQWMGRSGFGGTDRELKGNLSVRWTSSGGDSNTRFRSAVRGAETFHEIMQRCNFVCLDCFDFLDECKDENGHAVYADAPWPDDGDKYTHKFTTDDQRRLAVRLGQFKSARVVIRYGDHPLIRELYPKPQWTWRRITGRTQANNDKAEVLILNGPSVTEQVSTKGMFA